MTEDIENTFSGYCSRFDVEVATNLKFDDFKSTISNALDNDSEIIDKYKDISLNDRPMAVYKDMIQGWIITASGVIDEYCQRTTHFETIPETIKLVTVRIVINILNSNRKDRNSKFVKTDNYIVEYNSNTYLDKNSELMLKPFVPSMSSTLIDVGVVTGDTYPEDQETEDDLNV